METDNEEASNGGMMERIRACARIAGSGDELARITGINRRTLESYLSGQREPKASTAWRIAVAVDVSADWLIGGKGPMRPGEAPPSPPPATVPAILPPSDHRLRGRLAERILAVYKEMGMALSIHQAVELASVEHDRIIAVIDDADDRLIEVGEYAARLKQELRAKAESPGSGKRSA